MRKVCFVTGSRAEYGLLFWLMKAVAEDPQLTLQLAVTGTHLSARFGETVRDIERDGFTVDARVALDLDDDTAAATARATGQCLAGMAGALADLDPDVVMVLGDRFEILAAATAALILGIPIGHIAGGESTEGAMDEAFRHAITKMAHLHFPAAEPYRRRILQLGEDPAHVHTVGALALDNLEQLSLLDREALADAAGIDAAAPFLLVTYHPVTLGDANPSDGIAALLAALEAIDGFRIVFTGVNADPGNDAISRAITDYCDRRRDRTVRHESLGQVRYLSAMRHAAAVVGNSSSGIVEAPAMGVPTVNIGDRQRGRLRSASVIDCAADTAAIAAAIERAVSSGFRAEIGGKPYPFGTPGASRRILDVVRSAPLDGLSMKRFHDLSACGAVR